MISAAVEENKVEANVTAKISSIDNNGVTAEKMTLGDSCILCHGDKNCATCGGTGKVSQ